jgi:hypothetical protein
VAGFVFYDEMDDILGKSPTIHPPYVRQNLPPAGQAGPKASADIPPRTSTPQPSKAQQASTSYEQVPSLTDRPSFVGPPPSSFIAPRPSSSAPPLSSFIVPRPTPSAHHEEPFVPPVRPPLLRAGVPELPPELLLSDDEDNQLNNDNAFDSQQTGYEVIDLDLDFPDFDDPIEEPTQEQHTSQEQHNDVPTATTQPSNTQPKKRRASAVDPATELRKTSSKNKRRSKVENYDEVVKYEIDTQTDLKKEQLRFHQERMLENDKRQAAMEAKLVDRLEAQESKLLGLLEQQNERHQKTVDTLLALLKREQNIGL